MSELHAERDRRGLATPMTSGPPGQLPVGRHDVPWARQWPPSTSVGTSPPLERPAPAPRRAMPVGTRAAPPPRTPPRMSSTG